MASFFGSGNWGRPGGGQAQAVPRSPQQQLNTFDPRTMFQGMLQQQSPFARPEANQWLANMFGLQPGAWAGGPQPGMGQQQGSPFVGQQGGQQQMQGFGGMFQQLLQGMRQRGQLPGGFGQQFGQQGGWGQQQQLGGGSPYGAPAGIAPWMNGGPTPGGYAGFDQNGRWQQPDDGRFYAQGGTPWGSQQGYQMGMPFKPMPFEGGGYGGGYKNGGWNPMQRPGPPPGMGWQNAGPGWVGLAQRRDGGRVAGSEGERGPDQSPFAALNRFQGPFGNGAAPLTPQPGQNTARDLMPLLAGRMLF